MVHPCLARTCEMSPSRAAKSWLQGTQTHPRALSPPPLPAATFLMLLFSLVHGRRALVLARRAGVRLDAFSDEAILDLARRQRAVTRDDAVSSAGVQVHVRVERRGVVKRRTVRPRDRSNAAERRGCGCRRCGRRRAPLTTVRRNWGEQGAGHAVRGERDLGDCQHIAWRARGRPWKSRARARAVEDELLVRRGARRHASLRQRTHGMRRADDDGH